MGNQEAIWPLLAETTPGAGGEIQLTDAIAQLMQNHTTEAYHIVGKSHDCGSKAGYMLANIEYGLRHKDTADVLRAFMADFINRQVSTQQLVSSC